MLVEFVVGSGVAPRIFLRLLLGFSFPPKKSTCTNSDSPRIEDRHENQLRLPDVASLSSSLCIVTHFIPYPVNFAPSIDLPNNKNSKTGLKTDIFLILHQTYKAPDA